MEPQSSGMVNLERPCCDSPLIVELPLQASLRCDDCAVEWSIVDPVPAAMTTLAA
ncbi:MAG: hypothetical protein ABIV26_00035 [Candidatus Limnocylindrales bacterium]